MQKVNRIILLLFVLISCVGCDQATKMLARQHLATAPVQEYIGGLFRFIYAQYILIFGIFSILAFR